MKQKFFAKPVFAICLLSVMVSLLYAIFVPPFFLHFTDGLSICSVLLLLMGILNIWWKEGAFSFFLWKKDDGPYSEFLAKIKEERKSASSYTLYAGIWMLAVSLLLTGIYMLVY